MFRESKQTEKDRDNLIKAFESIGDILASEAKQKKSKNIANTLMRLDSVVSKLFVLKVAKPERFASLMLDVSLNDKQYQALKSFTLNFSMSMSALLAQIERVHEQCVVSDNFQGTQETIYWVGSMLRTVTSYPEASAFVDLFLRSVATMFFLSQEKRHKSKILASLNWYIYGPFMLDEPAKFRMEYLKEFNKTLFLILKSVIDEEDEALYKHILDFLLHGIVLKTYNNGKHWDYFLLQAYEGQQVPLEKLTECEEAAKLLDRSEGRLFTLEELQNAQAIFSSICSIIEPLMPDELKLEANKIEKDYRGYLNDTYKFHQLLDVVFAAGSYSIFNNKLDMVRQLIHTDDIASGHYLVPNSLSLLLTFYWYYIVKLRNHRHFGLFYKEEQSYRDFYITLLAKLLCQAKQQHNQTAPSRRDQVDGVMEFAKFPSLPEFDSITLKYIQDATPSLLERVKELSELSNWLDKMGMGEAKPYLEILIQAIGESAKDQINKRIQKQPLSTSKLEEFYQGVISGFNKTAITRSMYSYYGRYISDGQYKPEKDKMLGVKRLDDKAVFFDAWHTSYPNWGKGYGERLAFEEEQQIFIKLMRKARCEKALTVEVACNELLGDALVSPSELIIITSPKGIRLLHELETYQPEHSLKEKPFVEGFSGFYTHANIKIPIYRTRYNEMPVVLVTTVGSLGVLVQYPLLHGGGEENFLREFIYIRVRDIVAESEYLESFIEANSNLLAAHGNKEAEKAYLASRVSIEICEALELKLPEKFLGFCITEDAI